MGDRRRSGRKVTPADAAVGVTTPRRAPGRCARTTRPQGVQRNARACVTPRRWPLRRRAARAAAEHGDSQRSERMVDGDRPAHSAPTVPLIAALVFCSPLLPMPVQLAARGTESHKPSYAPNGQTSDSRGYGRIPRPLRPSERRPNPPDGATPRWLRMDRELSGLGCVACLCVGADRHAEWKRTPAESSLVVPI